MILLFCSTAGRSLTRPALAGDALGSRNPAFEGSMVLTLNQQHYPAVIAVHGKVFTGIESYAHAAG